MAESAGARHRRSTSRTAEGRGTSPSRAAASFSSRSRSKTRALENNIDEFASSMNGAAASTATSPQRRSSPSRSSASNPAPLSMDRAGSDTSPASPATPEASKQVELLVDSKAKWINFATRAKYAALMIGGFALCVYLGHVAITCLIIAIEIMMFKEVIHLALHWTQSMEKEIPAFKLLHWYHLFVTVYFTLVRAIKNQLRSWTWLMSHKAGVILVERHSFISFMLYITGFVIFVASLRKKYYKYQFSQFGWIGMTCLFVVGQASFMIGNVYEGIIWFLLPSSLVIVNDIFAYIFGFFFGRHPLIKLSPKKTWEGFIGATVSTIIWGVIVSALLSHYAFMVCPKVNFNQPHACEIPPVFLSHDYSVPEPLRFLTAILSGGIPWESVTIRPVQIHALWLAVFASLIAPFGGFFASGFKRAFKIKDFGDSIPGHGGFTDRFDCQIVMGVFSWVYISTFVKTVSLGDVLPRIEQLSLNDLINLQNKLPALIESAQNLLTQK